MDSVVKENLILLGQTMLEAPKNYRFYKADNFPIYFRGKRLYKTKVKNLTNTILVEANAVGHLPLILVEEYSYPEKEVKVEELAVKHLYGLCKTDLEWINLAKTTREAGIACLYLAWRQRPPEDYPSRPALARKKAREALSL